MKNIITILCCLAIISCKQAEDKSEAMENTNQEQVTSKPGESKKVVYQVFTRLFGNTNTTNRPWGTLEENGVGKVCRFHAKSPAGNKRPGRHAHLVHGSSPPRRDYRLYRIWHFKRRSRRCKRPRGIALCSKGLLQRKSRSCRKCRK